MKEMQAPIPLELPKDLAVDFADSLDLAVASLECITESEPFALESFAELLQMIDASETSETELEDSLRALRRVRHLMGKELPKHFPELSRAARRGQLDEDEDEEELYGEPGA